MVGLLFKLKNTFGITLREVAQAQFTLELP